jgi:hypothetical protein
MRLTRVPLVGVAALTLLAVTTVLSPLSAAASTTGGGPHVHIDCAGNAVNCAEVFDSESVFGTGVYVGHDEPSVLFYSNTPGSGSTNRWQVVLPTDPPPTNPAVAGKSYSFQLHVAFWFGMAMCDTQSYPEQVSTCTPDSDTNIVDPSVSPAHPGAAFMEMQFYPPGWVLWPGGTSCSATQWCAALNIDSLSENPVTGEQLNKTCAAITGLEYVNFAFITRSGVPQPNSPPNPVNSTLSTFTPDSTADLFMNPGDHIRVTMQDTEHGLRIQLDDLTTRQSGSMTASAANGFGQVLFAPGNSKTCQNIPYDFHPMYSTSSELTRVPWTAHSYNIAFADEIGHFDFCSQPVKVGLSGGGCAGSALEGIAADQESTDADDTFCFPASQSSLVQVSGCLGSNTGFDGLGYQNVWSDGNTELHPTPIQFSSPTTGRGFATQFDRAAFEADLPRIEDDKVCDRFTGVGCTLIPTTDDHAAPAVFYPFFSIAPSGIGCVWQIGSHIPGSISDFGQNAQYGQLLPLTYTAGSGISTRDNDFRQVLSSNPCQAGA